LGLWICGGLTLAGCQVPTKATLSLLSSVGQGRGNITKGSQVEIRTGRDHSPVTITGKTDSAWGKINLIYYQSNQSWKMRNKNKSYKHLPHNPPFFPGSASLLIFSTFSP